MERAFELSVSVIFRVIALGFVVYGILALFEFVPLFSAKTFTLAACLTFAGLFRRSE